MNRSCIPLFIRSTMFLAIVAVGTHEHAFALVVDNHLVQETFMRSTQRAFVFPVLDAERMILEIEALDLRIRRNGVNAPFAARSEKLQRGFMCILGLSNFGIGEGDER